MLTTDNNLRKREWLTAILTQQLGNNGGGWFAQRIAAVNDDEAGKNFNLLFSLIPRNISAAQAVWNEQLLQEAENFYPGFGKNPPDLQQLCRLLLMVRLPVTGNQEALKILFETADINELVILYKGLYWLDNAAGFVPRMTEGVRTNMVPVFDAIALNNPYPFQYFTDDAWNQMVLKAIFNGRPLYKIYKLHERKNQKLANILHDFIHERWAAGRTVTPEIWQLMPGFITPEIEADLRKAARSEDVHERNAATKALHESGIGTETVDSTWANIGEQYTNK